MQGLCAQFTRGLHLPFLSLYKQCNIIQGTCAKLTGGSICLLYIYIYIYICIYKQCNGMQGLYAQLTRGFICPIS